MKDLSYNSPKVCGNTENHNQHWVIYVESISNEGQHSHGSHYL